jgi:hypothetical protein
MNRRTTVTAALAAPALTVAILAAGAPQANALPYNSTPHCITKTEFSHIYKGQTLKSVRNHVGAYGSLTFSYDGYSIHERDYEFHPCRPYNQYSYAEVDFEKKGSYWKVTGKSAYWIHN